MTIQPHDPAAVDSPAMRQWCREMNCVADFLRDAAQRHVSDDHALCEDAQSWLMLAFADIGLTEAEARVLLGCFADVMRSYFADIDLFARLWAGYFDREGVA